VPRSCTVCSHEARDEIDRALVAGQSSYLLADRYSSLSRPSLERHKGNHLPARMVMAQAAEEVAQADSLLSQVRDLQERALCILDKAEGAGELRIALGAIREARGNLELLAKLLGELDERPQVNILLSPEWLSLRTKLLYALNRYPEARDSILRALEGRGDGGR
jgi:tetratricopeptide (TPR) repeat protein